MVTRSRICWCLRTNQTELVFAVFLILADPCNENDPLLVIKNSGTIIQSPDYPSNYPNGANCRWQIKAASNQVKRHYATRERILLL